MWVGITVVALVLAAIALEAVNRSRDRRRFPAPGHLVDIGGRRLHMHVAGVGEPAVVFESGAGNEGSVWTLVQREVAKHTRTVAYDRAGMGWSDPDESSRRVATYSDDLRTLLEHSDVRPPYVLVAHSLGGLFAMDFASRYPDSVAGMVFVDAGYKRTYETLAERTPGMAARIRRQVRLAGAASVLCRLGVTRLIARRIFGTGDLPQDVVAAQRSHLNEKLLAAMANEGRTTFGAPLEEARSDPPRDLPVVVLTHGRPSMRIRGQDPEDVEHGWQDLQRGLAEMFADAKHLVVEGTAHHIHVERPDVVVAAILEVVDTARTRRT